MESLLGNHVVRKDNSTVDVSSFSGSDKVVGLYFSAHWCPPCRGFTPKLSKWYEDIKKTDNGENFEIVFVSSDRSEGQWKEYYDEMSWLALPYSDRDLKDKLSKKFKVSGIPTLVFVDGTGRLITSKGRDVIADDPKGEKFPWKPKPYKDIISEGKLIKNDDTEYDASALNEKIVGLYFSAHWCPPCKAFTPTLVKTYNKLKEAGKDFEIVFCSSDRDAASFKSYFSDMPWLALPFKADCDRKKTLSSLFEIEGIPSLIIIDKEGKMITSNGRGAVGGDPNGEEFPWTPKALNQLSESNAGKLNDAACLILFTGCVDQEKSKENIAKAVDVLSEEAEKFHSKGDDQDLFFFYEGEDDVTDSLRDFCKLDDKVVLAIFDIPGSKMFIHESADLHSLTKEMVKTYIDDWSNDKLKEQKIRGN